MCSGRLLAAQGRIGSGYVGFVLRRALQTSASRMRAFGCRRSCITRKARCPGYGNLRPPQRNPLLNASTSGSSGIPEKFPDASQPEPTPNCSVRIVGIVRIDRVIRTALTVQCVRHPLMRLPAGPDAPNRVTSTENGPPKRGAVPFIICRMRYKPGSVTESVELGLSPTSTRLFSDTPSER